MGMTVFEMAAATGASPDAIRWYVRNGLLEPRRNAGNGYCEFNAVDNRELRFIRRAKSRGFTLAVFERRVSPELRR
jgi:DNA-binding transcriptional MerR regulator